MAKKAWGQVRRGVFQLGEKDHVVLVSSTADFVMTMVAHNATSTKAGLRLTTPASPFRSETNDEQDSLVLDVPAATGLSLGAIGGEGGETLEVSATEGSSLTVFLTVTTGKAADVTMVALPRNGVKRKVKAQRNARAKRGKS